MAKLALAATSGKSCKVLLGLRLLAFSATLSAAIVMGLNKETETFVVGKVGNTPIKATFTAKFDHTPAFVFFVVANAMVSFHNFLMIALQIFGGKMEFTGFRLLSVAILDMLNVTLVSAAANAAAFMAEVGKNGNKHARWDKICDRFATYCDHGAGALIAAFAGVILMLIISAASISRLVQPNKSCSTTASPSVVP
ncbi:Casparian strip membrane protein domain [Arabidopsis thaliana x Arabidopsis arenosa]|uniref:CASP-like protein n=1 Tax=Arabidopsis thaliana x Arabidopsis arenosa TaxID=1240361 RepID=A0A8T1XKD4_9BRAS|nr:Casparian strip membrane protein domain [Arabidopsis thaliana x Arabidopsis arenosa]